ncbi:hypothetical protein GF359_10550 [candidate division WOR-3 bacterium]|uniref:DUF4468 domain-containing protein n=1 Tax=candidate division WOR-3 bacterium TaxID=2052148 RepID=A0A9D5KAX4_UNCW3|nr:hypothetical protein [candidate division WOR-3 bacterium]MBD3365641.1 hypothetical protein [candidate division WOR-3 bacterium]
MLKKIIVVGSIAALLIPAVSFAADDYTTMKEMVSEMYTYVEYLEDEMSQEIVHLHADIIFDEPKPFTRPLYSGWTYAVTAYADWRVADLDIIVYKDVDGQWVEIDRDEEEDNTPIVIVEPSSDGMYKIEIEVYSYNIDEDSGEYYTAAHYGLIISHEYEY